MNNIKKSKVSLLLVWLYETVVVLISFFSVRKKITTRHQFKEPFFIIGCGRSGNTLLRSMLVTGKEVVIPPESYVWPRLIRRFWPMSFLRWEILCSWVIGEFEAHKFDTWEVNLYKAHEKARGLPKNRRTLSNILHVIYSTYAEEKNQKDIRWGDKTPINTIYIDKLYKIFPNAQFIHIVRDPRDVVCSYVKAGLYDNIWDALDFWIESNKKAVKLETLLGKDQYFQVKYEKLVEFPEDELKKICTFLNINYSTKLLDFWKYSDNLGDVKRRKHHVNIGNPLNTDSIGKWKTVLNQEEKEIIETKAASEMRLFGYLDK
ncbi:sulfotransferase [Muricauda sp. NFXS6]|uniref:sulfotransferase family protein n=1 Tax=Allomuricauda sp. NFXS6 TaxID=2819094 RepID=UPI0032DF4F20